MSPAIVVRTRTAVAASLVSVSAAAAAAVAAVVMAQIAPALRLCLIGCILVLAVKEYNSGRLLLLLL